MRRGCFLRVVESTGTGARPLGILPTLPGSSFVIAEIKLNFIYVGDMTVDR